MKNHPDIFVRGGNALTGHVQVSGAKNSVLKLMAASILAPGVTKLGNVPMISDVFTMAEVLTQLGIEVAMGESDLTINSATLNSYDTPYDLVKEMRASIAVLGPLIGRYGQAKVSIPGGCNLGSRPIDLHVTALEALGVSFDTESGDIIATTPNGLNGTPVTLGFPSVGATENLMMAAVLARGTTLINNAAREPEIVDLANYLNEMGAQVTGAGSPCITIEGVSELRPVALHRTIGDRIEAGTFLVAGALAGGPVTVTGIDPSYLSTALDKLRDLGNIVTTTSESITIQRTRGLVATDVQTLPFPGFPTDLQPQITMLACLAEGVSIIAENIFENRFIYTGELVRMGADIRVNGHFAKVTGVSGLSGAPVQAPDLRACAALILAGLVANGTTRVSNTEHVDRGYERFTEKLASLGADIRRA